MERKAECHPDRPHLAKGLCASCYVTQRRQRKRAAMNEEELEAARASQRDYFREYRKNWRAANPEREKINRRNGNERAYKRDPIKHRERTAASRYGLTVEQYRALIAGANGKCEVCGVTPKSTLHIDHCHATGKIRGVLCGNCNSALGHAGDDVARLEGLIRYLRRAQGGAAGEFC